MSVLSTTLRYIKSAKIYPSSEDVYYGIISNWEVHLSDCIKIYTVTLIKGNENSEHFKKDYYFQVDDRTIPSFKRDTKVDFTSTDFTCISFGKDNFQEFEFNLTESDKKFEKDLFDLNLKNNKIPKIFERILEDCLKKYIRENPSVNERSTLLSGTLGRSSPMSGNNEESVPYWKKIFCCCFSRN